MSVEHAAFAALPVQVAAGAVRAVEDAIDAHLRTTPSETYPLDGEQGPAVVQALLDLGWTPPRGPRTGVAPGRDATPLGDIADT